MIEKMKVLLQGQSENHLMPFFWQHGEDEATLRQRDHRTGNRIF